MEPAADAPTDAAAPEADESAPAAPGEAAEADGENDGQGGKGNSRKDRTLEQMMSLKPGDDERTQISKKVSWILRHGAKKVNIDIDDDGWVSVENLLGSEILQGVEESRLMDMINESNIQKPRYEVRQTDNGKCVRAVAKHTIQGMTTSTNKGGDRRRPGKGGGGRGEDQYDGRGGDREPGGWRAARPPNPPGAGATHQSSEAAEAPKEMTYEQQLQEGYTPVFQGQQVLAMIRGEETASAGKKGYADKGKGRGGPGDAKGKFEGYSDGKAFGRGKPSWPDDQFSGGGYPSDEGYGYQDNGKGFKGKSKDSKGCGYGYGKDSKGCGGGSVPCKWVCQRGQDAIVRATQNIESAMVGAVHPGQVVTQTGEEVKAAHGIMRMPVEFVSDETGQRMSGWVTRTAEAASGPIYFRPVANGGKSAAPSAPAAAQGRYGGGGGYEQGPCGPSRGFDKGGGGFGQGGGCGPRGYGGGHNGYDQGYGGGGGYGGGAQGNYGGYGGYQPGKGYR